MSFQIYTATPSAAVATNGTIAFTVPANFVGQAEVEGGHLMYSEGLQTLFTFPVGFTIAWTASTATVTYLGTSTIPAGTNVKLQLEVAGENNYLTTAYPPIDVVYDYLKTHPRAVLAREYRVIFGTVTAASATAILNASVTPTTGVAIANTTQLDVPRGVTIKSSSTSDTTPSSVTIRSLDELGVAMTETLTLNGTSAVNGAKAHYTIVSITPNSTQMVGNLSVGTQAGVLGMPFYLSGTTGAYVRESVDGAVAGTAGTFVAGVLTAASATTGDVRGTYTPNTAPNGTHYYEVLIYASDLSFKGVTQF